MTAELRHFFLLATSLVTLRDVGIGSSPILLQGSLGCSKKAFREAENKELLIPTPPRINNLSAPVWGQAPLKCYSQEGVSRAS